MNAYYDRFDVRVGVIADEFMFEALRPAAKLVYISPTDDVGTVVGGIDCLLVVTTWHGCRDFDWQGVSKEGTPQRDKLYEIIDRCRERKIPVVFYSKEDPPNYAVFIDIARRCDFVWTSAAEMMASYRKDCGHDRVGTLTFCINPEIQNPAGNGSSDPDSVVFSGSWMSRYPKRGVDLLLLFDGVARSGKRFCIYDRNSFRTKNRKYRYPTRFAHCVRPGLPHGEILELHRKSTWALNVNTVSRSVTMFAVRCLELSACGVNVISNYSIGVHRLIPEVTLAYSSDGVAEILRRATPSWTAFRSACAVRAVTSGDTCWKSVGRILSGAGFKVEVPRRKVAVVVPKIDAAVREMFDSQTYSPRELLSTEDLERVGTEGFDFVSEWKEGAYFNPYWLEDAINCFKWDDFGVVESPGGRTVRVGHEDGKRFAAGPFELPDVPSDEGAFAATVEIDVGDDRRQLLACVFSGLFLCRCFSRLRIVLAGLEGASAATLGVAKMLCRRYPNVSIGPDATSDKLPRIALLAGDEVMPAEFDRLVRRLGRFWVGKVRCAAFLCGRDVQRTADGFTISTGRPGLCSVLRSPVIARHSREADPPGECWIDHSNDHLSFMERTAKCYRENGFWYTARRLLLGKN